MTISSETRPTATVQSKIWIILAIAYLIIRFAFTRWIDSLGEYASYIFEFSLVIIAALLCRPNFKTYFKLPRIAAPAAVFSLVAGYGIFVIAGVLHLFIPFDLNGAETILFLLIVAPILEELLFRFFLWQPLENLSNRPIVAWLGTTLIFSYSHLHAIWFVPGEFHPFIVYQTIYTLFLGLACGALVYKNRSLGASMLVHFAFNLGFYLASLR